MRSNYKRLGKYIKPVNVRNTKLDVNTLLGVSIQKILMPSIANTVGTDMSKYKIIRKEQFAYGPVTSRNGNKISVALLEKNDAAIVSQAYTVFEITDHTELDPEYLMMWFRRPEFDRYARFKSHGSAREIFDWDEMCDTELPIPSIQKQYEIVKEYNTIANRLKLNEELNQKLEETAQTVYKHWFVDFEFHDENGKPYKSSGGKMVWCEELGMDVPVGWGSDSIKNFCIEMKSGGTPNRSTYTFWNSNDIPWLKTGEIYNTVLVEAEEYISFSGLKNSSAKILPVNSVLIAMYGEGHTKGQVGLLRFKATTNQACCAMICNNEQKSSFLYYHLRVNRNEIVSVAIGGAQPNLSKALIENIKLVNPSECVLQKHPLMNMLNSREVLIRENNVLAKIENLILSKMSKVETFQTEQII